MSKTFYKVLASVFAIKLIYCLVLLTQYAKINDMLQTANTDLLKAIVKFCGR